MRPRNLPFGNAMGKRKRAIADNDSTRITGSSIASRFRYISKNMLGDMMPLRVLTASVAGVAGIVIGVMTITQNIQVVGFG